MRRLVTAAAFFLAPIAALSGCDTPGVSGTPEVRVENRSTLVFDEVRYWAANNELTYTDLGAGSASPYVEASGAYGYTTTMVVVGSDTLRLQVIDYVGETPLADGRYTYVLDVLGEAGSRSLTQELRRDP